MILRRGVLEVAAAFVCFMLAFPLVGVPATVDFVMYACVFAPTLSSMLSDSECACKIRGTAVSFNSCTIPLDHRQLSYESSTDNSFMRDHRQLQTTLLWGGAG